MLALLLQRGTDVPHLRPTLLQIPILHHLAIPTVIMLQVDTIFMTHLHGDHCFGIGSMLISLCNARRRAMQDQQQQLDSHNQQLQQQQQGPDQGPDKLRVVGGPKLGQFVSALLTGAGVARQLDMPVYVTEFVEDDRCV